MLSHFHPDICRNWALNLFHFFSHIPNLQLSLLLVIPGFIIFKETLELEMAIQFQKATWTLKHKLWNAGQFLYLVAMCLIKCNVQFLEVAINKSKSNVSFKKTEKEPSWSSIQEVWHSPSE